MSESVRPAIGVIILAAGEGSRMRSGAALPKQLLDFGGQPLIRLVAGNALGSVCRPVVVVLGANAEPIRRALEGLDVVTVENPRWQEGMGTSIQAGLDALGEAGGAILMLGDQPLITPEILNELVEMHGKTGRPIVTAEYAGTVGVPVLFADSYFPHLRALDPDKGCKGVILKNRGEAAGLACPEAEADIDTFEDYKRIAALIATQR